ncbi:hypothetical protein L9F63_009023, partial [Diploptera punctata]
LRTVPGNHWSDVVHRRGGEQSQSDKLYLHIDFTEFTSFQELNLFCVINIKSRHGMRFQSLHGRNISVKKYQRLNKTFSN